ncbi:MAG: hypothetical protein QS721_04100 [Candidatus Endonucleobacter sp. (ex Gigantidas childressi)]|nr:hypothetical protein [Candidatus Endonucleobacter sp. (ex Gigantidas childressi)]
MEPIADFRLVVEWSGKTDYTSSLSSCYVVGCVRSPRSPTTRRLTGFAYLLPSSNLKCFGYSYESIYLHIWANKQASGDIYMHLRRQGKKYDKRRNGKSTRGQIKNRVSMMIARDRSR